MNRTSLWEAEWEDRSVDGRYKGSYVRHMGLVSWEIKIKWGFVLASMRAMFAKLYCRQQEVAEWMMTRIQEKKECGRKDSKLGNLCTIGCKVREQNRCESSKQGSNYEIIRGCDPSNNNHLGVTSWKLSHCGDCTKVSCDNDNTQGECLAAGSALDSFCFNRVGGERRVRSRLL